MATPPLSARQLNSLQDAEGLQEYLLKDVKRNGRQLGNGAYGIVEELEVNGVVVAGKKIHETLVDPFNQGADNVRAQFVKECSIMSRLRHPHIVQFLGVYFQERAPLPVLVMEYLPHSLDALLEGRPNIAISMKVSFLYDVAKGLAYLHGQDPPIIHRDLTARNVLLNSAMVAKIADFGVARIVNLHGNQAAALTRIPGALVYMPPEADEDAKYNTKLDIFSYGVVMLFTITQEFPNNILPATYLSSERPQVLLARAEVERRERYYEVAYRLLGEIYPAHKLVKLSEVCLSNDPAQRPTVDLLITVLRELRERLSDPFLEKDKLELMDLARAAEERGRQVEDERVRVSSTDDGHVRELQSRVDQQRQQLAVQSRQLAEMEGEVTRAREQSQRQLEAKEHEVAEIRRREHVLTVDLVRRDEQYEQARSELHRKGVQIQELESELAQKEREMAPKEAEIQELYERIGEMHISDNQQPMADELSAKEAELVALREELREKEVKMEALKTELAEVQRELTKALRELAREKELTRERRPPIQGPPQPSGLTVRLPVRWKTGSSAPFGMNDAHCIYFKKENKLLFGGGNATGDKEKRILEYDVSSQTWGEFPVYVLRLFAIAVLGDEVLLVGGFDDMKDEYSNRVSAYVKQGSHWRKYTAMPTPRCEVAAVGYKRWLVAAGGFNGSVTLDVVEVFDSSTSQWSVVHSLPEPSMGLRSAVAVDSSGSGKDVWYLLGKGGLRNRTPAFAISLALLTSQAGGGGAGVNPWSVLPPPPFDCSGAVAVRGFLLAVGGKQRHSQQQEVYIYLPGTCEWLHVANLPSARHSCSCTSLLVDSKFVVFGGRETRDYSTSFIYGSVNVVTEHK